MTTDVIKAPSDAVDLFAPETRDVIKKTVAKDATPAELDMFLHVCMRTRLDPFARQIHFVKRGGKPTIQTGIDGYRLIADRTGLYAGSDDYRFDDGLSVFAHMQQYAGKDKKPYPLTATATIYKIIGGIRCPFTVTVRWEEYFPGDAQGHMWRKMPYLMLGKCAEALALRKAFPAELFAVHTSEQDARLATIEDVEVLAEAVPEPPAPYPIEADPEPDTGDSIAEPLSDEPPKSAPAPSSPADDRIAPAAVKAVYTATRAKIGAKKLSWGAPHFARLMHSHGIASGNPIDIPKSKYNQIMKDLKSPALLEEIDAAVREDRRRKLEAAPDRRAQA